MFDFSLGSILTHANTLLLVGGVGALVAWASRQCDPNSKLIERLTKGRTGSDEQPPRQ